jgi:hypothetical protein
MLTVLLSENLDRRNHRENRSVDGRTILKRTCKEMDSTYLVHHRNQEGGRMNTWAP